ncbi:MAG: hypothetical protein D3923_09325, partial [Candidatus Electrothrix sp. AR3]|nr:hypothetical protein [Candidatus Electrothrix sp. AR3]
MKKIFILLLLLTGAAGAAYYYLNPYSVPTISNDYYAEYLPPDSLAVVSLLNIKSLSKTFPKSALGAFLAKPTMHDIMQERGAGQEDIQRYDDLYDGLAGVLTNPAFHQVFGDDTVIGMLPLDPVRLQADPAKEIQNSLLVFASSSAAGSIDRFARLVMGRDMNTQTVDGVALTRIRLDENEVIYGSAKNGVIILAYTPGNITAAIKQKTKGTNLSDTADFIAAKKFWAESALHHGFLKTYINLAGFRTLLSFSKQQPILPAAQYLQGFKSVAGFITEHQGLLRCITRAEYDFSLLHKQVQLQYQSLAEHNLSLPLLTDKTLAYYWFSPLEQLFAGKIFSAGNKAKYEGVAAAVEEELGFSLQQIMDATGPQAGLLVNDIVNTGLFPLPRLVLFVQIKDFHTAQEIITRLRSKIAERGFAEEQSSEINGQTIYYWSVLPHEATHLALVLTDNMLYISNGESSLQGLLARAQGQSDLSPSMLSNLGPALTQQITDANYSLFVLRPALLASKIREISAWLSGILSAGSTSTEKVQEELLTLMESIEVATGSGKLEHDHA